MMGIKQEEKHIGFKFEHFKQAGDEMINDHKQIQHAVIMRKWEERQEVYDHKVWLLEDA
jgi:hypothetical protein